MWHVQTHKQTYKHVQTDRQTDKQTNRMVYKVAAHLKIRQTPNMYSLFERYCILRVLPCWPAHPSVAAPLLPRIWFSRSSFSCSSLGSLYSVSAQQQQSGPVSPSALLSGIKTWENVRKRYFFRVQCSMPIIPPIMVKSKFFLKNFSVGSLLIAP